MCGIAGIIAREDASGPLSRMVASMRHRGPDDSGIGRVSPAAPGVMLGSTRLAIIDLSPAGHMPLGDPATGNWIVFNGEVFNFLELRRELEGLGETFVSRTDTEVILKAYQRWGRDCVQRFRGMFAFAIWDEARRELWLVRDRLGKKPLYYHRGPSGLFVFGSEVRALLASGFVPRRLNPAAVESFVFNGFVVSPLSIIEGVRSLLPGHWMRVSGGGEVIETRRYWRPVAAAAAPNLDALIEEARARLEDAVRLRLLSDVPLGAFLSGGLDSSAIVAIIAKAGVDVRTFSIAFDERNYDESRFSDWVSRRFHTVHTKVRLTRQDFQSWLPQAMEAVDQPTFDGVNTYFVSRAARENGLTVALSGLGADELFGGYPFFRTVPSLARLGRLASYLPAELSAPLARWPGSGGFHLSGAWKVLELLGDSRQRRERSVLRAYQTAQMLFPQWVRNRLLAQRNGPLWFGLPEEFLEFVAAELEPGDALDTVSRITLRLFLGERCLRDTDAMSMGASLEVRAPFTDHCFLETILKVPAAHRCQGAPDKTFERRLVGAYLDPAYPVRRKQGFIFPFQEWLAQPELLGLVQDTLSEERLAACAGLVPAAVRQLVSDFRTARRGIPWSRIWCLFVLLWWCGRHRASL